MAALLAARTLDYAAQPAGGFAAVVHQSNATHNVRFGDLLSMFEGANRDWPNGLRA
jgi:hypothetical protein